MLHFRHCLFSSSEQLPLIPASSITSAATVAVCQTLPTVCPLVACLATMATLAFKLGWSVLVRLECSCFALALTKHPFPLPLPTASTSIGVALALFESNYTPRPSLSKTKLRHVLSHHSILPASRSSCQSDHVSDRLGCDAGTTIFMPSEKVPRLSPSLLLDSSFPLSQLIQEVRCVSRIPTRLHDSNEHCCVSSSCVRLAPT